MSLFFPILIKVKIYNGNDIVIVFDKTDLRIQKKCLVTPDQMK